jgi:hypothetical protein
MTTKAATALYFLRSLILEGLGQERRSQGVLDEVNGHSRAHGSIVTHIHWMDVISIASIVNTECSDLRQIQMSPVQECVSPMMIHTKATYTWDEKMDGGPDPNFGRSVEE